ncbi:hypothetical protein [Actinocatenispora comari]|uniref:Uncharacterized protein n=1 Tax=Actinocatenispora comari TaxID=2807577 RepID=A0A8J4AE43_9ACTN|nr:hypothetical protein [Actinocatenispora comari]GIL27950.1 hypothetical protein NUM_32040 [Actinocatenispora comari]
MGSDTDFSYENDDAIDALHLYDHYDNGEIGGHTKKHPDGWAATAIEQIEATETTEGAYGKDRTPHQEVHWDKLNVSDAELKDYKELWNWYRNELPDKWNDYVKQFDQSDVSNVDVPKYDPNKQYLTPDDGDFHKPDTKTYTGGSDNAKGEMVVSTDAIKYFAKQLRTVADDGKGVFYDIYNKFGELEPKPGRFARAEVLRQKLAGTGPSDGGLIGDTQGLMRQIHMTLFSLHDALLAMAKEYEDNETNVRKKGEKFKDMTEAELNQFMSDPFSDIDGIQDYGGTETKGGDGGNGDGNGGDGGGDGK